VPLTPADIRALAEAHGLRVVSSALRRSDVIVAADTTELRPIDRLHRRRGTRLMVERTFWMSIHADMD
jgi:hypothetical protein